MPIPAQPKARNPNAKVFFVLTPTGKEMRVKAESFSVAAGGGAINFTTAGAVVATFSLANVTAVAEPGTLLREKP